MTRDELLLATLREGDATSVRASRRTGLTERVCRSGLHHLVDQGYAWTPSRGTWRLTSGGQAIAAALGPLPPVPPSRVPEATEPATPALPPESPIVKAPADEVRVVPDVPAPSPFPGPSSAVAAQVEGLPAQPSPRSAAVPGSLALVVGAVVLGGIMGLAYLSSRAQGGTPVEASPTPAPDPGDNGLGRSWY